MKIETTTYLWASKGMWLTDGVVCAKTIKLAEDRRPEEFWEITEEEKLIMFPEEEKEGAIGNDPAEVE